MNKEKINKLCALLQNRVFFYTLVILIFALVIVFSLLKIYNAIIVSIFVFWVYAILYCLTNFRRNFLLFIMLLCYFTFIISRPLISFFRGNLWWYFSVTAIRKSLITIYLSLCFILIGDRIYKHLKENKAILANLNKKVKKIKNKIYTIIFGKRNVLKKKIINDEIIGKNDKSVISKIYEFKFDDILFSSVILSWMINFYVEMENYLLLHDMDYETVYTSVVPSHHLIIRVISSLYLFFTFAYLATKPSKHKTVVTLLFLVISSVPSFLLGSRNMLVLGVLFSFVYIFIRDCLKKREKWITKGIKRALLVFVPIFVIFMGAYNYIRNNDENAPSMLELVVDTFYKQGTTFDTICQGYQYEKEILQTKNISYSFGDIIDYLGHNTISQLLFKTEPFPSGNSMIIVNEGNSLAHKVSYYALGAKSYLDGHGRGTSYIIETYMDGSYIWLCVYSLIIGYFLSMIVDLIRKNKMFLSYFVLVTIYSIFLLPRYSASGFIAFIVKPYFWFVMLFLYLCNKYLSHEDN